jgi:hypothetical protein
MRQAYFRVPPKPCPILSSSWPRPIAPSSLSLAATSLQVWRPCAMRGSWRGSVLSQASSPTSSSVGRNLVLPGTQSRSLLKQSLASGSEAGSLLTACDRASPGNTTFHTKYERSLMQKITPFLWFDGKLEEAVTLYTNVLHNAQRSRRERQPVERILRARWSGVYGPQWRATIQVQRSSLILRPM